VVGYIRLPHNAGSVISGRVSSRPVENVLANARKATSD